MSVYAVSTLRCINKYKSVQISRRRKAWFVPPSKDKQLHAHCMSNRIVSLKCSKFDIHSQMHTVSKQAGDDAFLFHSFILSVYFFFPFFFSKIGQACSNKHGGCDSRTTLQIYLKWLCTLDFLFWFFYAWLIIVFFVSFFSFVYLLICLEFYYPFFFFFLLLIIICDW